VAPDWLLRALALVMAELRDVTPHLGRRDVVSNAKATRLFGLRFIPPEDALLASAQSLIEKGLA